MEKLAYLAGTETKASWPFRLTEHPLQGTPLILTGSTLSKLKPCQKDLEVSSLIKIVTTNEWP